MYFITDENRRIARSAQHHAHILRVVHRDVSRSNIRLSRLAVRKNVERFHSVAEYVLLFLSIRR